MHTGESKFLATFRVKSVEFAPGCDRLSALDFSRMSKHDTHTILVVVGNQSVRGEFVAGFRFFFPVASIRASWAFQQAGCPVNCSRVCTRFAPKDGLQRHKKEGATYVTPL